MRGHGKRLTALSRRKLEVRAKRGSRMATLPGAIEAIVDQMTLQGELDFAFVKLPSGTPMSCQVGVEEFEENDGELIERGSWILSGRLGLIDAS